MNKRYKISHGMLIFWTLFVGIGAVAGAVGMFSDVSGKAMGMDTMLKYFAVLPFADKLFTNYLFSGIALLVVNGITNIISAILLILKRKSGVITGGVFGITLMAWIVIQFAILPANVLSTLYFFFGLAQLITGIVCYIGLKQSEFKFDIADYTEVGTKGGRLVVYFSRDGYTKKIAYEIANETGADVYEVKSTERTEGVPGFWWCGRYGMHKWGMPIVEPEIEWDKYDNVTVCTPVWVFSVASPIREFLKHSKDKITSLEIVSTHFMNAEFASVKEEIETCVGVKCNKYTSLCCRFGQTK